MNHRWRNITALGFLGLGVTSLVVPGCGNRLGPVTATQSAGSIGKTNLPNIAVERAKECMDMDGQQLGPGRVVLESPVTVNEDGDIVSVDVGGLPETAGDFGACIRNVFRDMPIATQPLEEGVQMLNFHLKHAGDSQEALIKYMNLMPGVPIVDSELMLEADGYTAVLPVTVKVVPDLEKFAALDKEILKKIGQMALDSLGYEEIMKRAEQQGWVKRVRVPRAQTAESKQFLAQDAAAIAADVFTRVFTKAAPVALLTSQADSFLPGPGDIGGLGIMAGALIVAGAITVYTIATAPAATATSAPPVTTATATPTATATTTSPPIAVPRKHPKQTCDDKRLAELEATKKSICYSEKWGCKDELENLGKRNEKLFTCVELFARVARGTACIKARQQIQTECFAGSPEAGHDTEIEEFTRGLNRCIAKVAIRGPGGGPCVQ